MYKQLQGLITRIKQKYPFTHSQLSIDKFWGIGLSTWTEEGRLKRITQMFITDHGARVERAQRAGHFLTEFLGCWLSFRRRRNFVVLDSPFSYLGT